MAERCLIDRAWRKMKSRCDNEKDISYKNYGGRGIHYCKEWAMFESFKKEMGCVFKKGLSLDRVDNNKGYYKDNCKWSTKKEQANNRRTNRFFTINGITKTFAQWIDVCNVKANLAKQRFYCCGWTIEESLNMEVRHR